MIAVTGSIAYDYIMNFNGKFEDHIIKEKTDNINVSFFAESLEKHFGGTAGNIAYNLSLLGEEIFLISTIGNDFSDYFGQLDNLNISKEHLTIVEDDITASAYILTDNSSNQITSFYGGAMLKADEKEISSFANIDYAIIAATELNTMLCHAEDCLTNNIPYVLDLGQSLPLWTKEPLMKYIKNCEITIVNDYELSMVAKILEVEKEEIKNLTKNLIVTLGEKGSVLFSEGEKQEIPVVKAKKVIDPTGCGDAYRAGIMYSLSKNLDLLDGCRLGSVISSFAVEYKGTQKHFFDKEELVKRFEETYKFNILK